MGYQEVGNSNFNGHLTPPNFKREGYGFAGWNTKIDGTGTNYGPMEDDPKLDYSEKGLTLYARWIASEGTLQEWNGCDELGIGQMTALTDIRDGNVYAVAKLVDGNCWMAENLRLDSNMTATINSQNTDRPADSFKSLPSSSDNWCTTYEEECIDRLLINNNNTNIGGTNESGETLLPGYDKWASGDQWQWYAYGNYYNWYTATARDGKYGIDSGEIYSSICPKGWNLPSQSANGDPALIETDTMKLARAFYGSSNYSYYDSDYGKSFRDYPNNFLLSGAWIDGNTSSSRGYNGEYCTSYSRQSPYDGFRISSSY